MLQYLKNHLLLVVIVPLLLLLIGASFYRFMMLEDYIVSYEGFCDEETESCFAECEDEECTSEYYFTIVERHAVTIGELCGEDILDCEAANSCLPDENDCSVMHCDPVADGTCDPINPTES